MVKQKFHQLRSIDILERDILFYFYRDNMNDNDLIEINSIIARCKFEIWKRRNCYKHEDVKLTLEEVLVKL